jgi:hypothetical protein
LFYFLLKKMGSHSRGQYDGGSSPGLSGLMQDVDSYIYELSSNQSQNGVAGHSSQSHYPQQQSRPYNGYMSSPQRHQNMTVRTAVTIALFKSRHVVRHLMTVPRPLEITRFLPPKYGYT